METVALTPETMATLTQMAHDFYPHDRIADALYLVAVKGYDTAEAAPEIEVGIAAINSAAVAKGKVSYLAIGCERDRVDILRNMEDSAFFNCKSSFFRSPSRLEMLSFFVLPSSINFNRFSGSVSRLVSLAISF